MILISNEIKKREQIFILYSWSLKYAWTVFVSCLIITNMQTVRQNGLTNNSTQQLSHHQHCRCWCFKSNHKYFAEMYKFVNDKSSYMTKIHSNYIKYFARSRDDAEIMVTMIILFLNQWKCNWILSHFCADFNNGTDSHFFFAIKSQLIQCTNCTKYRIENFFHWSKRMLFKTDRNFWNICWLKHFRMHQMW